ncbi:Neurotransmitter-gated ion-channel transmembrane domain [Trinorchestia longiramus]|nr:Neurotransmitter-gated ion-channel transmembrane domain [Trinorchestia longiramus]
MGNVVSTWPLSLKIYLCNRLFTQAIDVWTGACLTFVFGALLEFALVNYASRSDFQRDQQLMRLRWETDSQLTLFDMQMQQQQLQQVRLSSPTPNKLDKHVAPSS